MSWRSLTRKSEFQETYEKGAKFVGRLLVLYLLPAEDQAWAVVASRKVGKAVRRNRAKRLLREARRQGFLGRPEATASLLARLNPRPDGEGAVPAGLWVVLVARQGILAASSCEVRQELDDLLDRA